jgi:betaine-aldehyde dehydrogenase
MSGVNARPSGCSNESDETADYYERDFFWIAGQRARPKTPGRLEVICPSTEARVGSVPVATDDDIDRAVTAARRAFDAGPWPHLTLDDRAATLMTAYESLAARIEDIGHLTTSEMGVPITTAVGAYTPRALGLIPQSIAFAREITFEERRPGSMSSALVWREPVGVTAAIAPWNGPFMNAIGKVAPALLVGCTVVYKPAPETPLDAYCFADALHDAGLPEGVFNLVPAGREVGEHLVRHPGVDKVSFTGSTAAGRRVGAICGEHLKRVTLELGGKGAAIILEDADLDSAALALGQSAFGNSGQVCASFSRVLAPRSRYDEVVAVLVARASAAVVGDPFDPATTLGPLVAERQRARVESYITAGLQEGARLVHGGGRPATLDRGWYIEPTVFADVDNSSRIAQEEIFGPVVAVIPYDGEDHAVALANDTAYGLHSGVFTSDTERGIALARRIRAGTFTVNGYLVNFDAPFGGVKCSGIGREFGLEGVLGFTEQKTVNVPGT